VFKPKNKSSKDNSIFRMDFKSEIRGRTKINKSFARVKRIFKHTMFPGGPTNIFVQGEWYKDEGVCPIAGTHLVSPHPEHHFTHESKFSLLSQCYQQPVALWPFDPLKKLPTLDARRNFFDVIDRNEEQQMS
jgi:hypothetical protein